MRRSIHLPLALGLTLTFIAPTATRAFFDPALRNPVDSKRSAPAAPELKTDSKILQERARSILEEYRAKSGFPGAVAAARLADGRLISVAVGHADRERKTPMKPASRMLGGSTGKTFFAALALQLLAEKKLRLDDPVKMYLGRKPWFA
ncbi:MAG TPA: serine hydrolase domain-containing protein, partial [Pyrinomonadaceae bacterium]|nr:serine hydrolase domain-containing protein [Pyrinomonadaceae bacterium]